jgi:hypothetical protein
MSNLRALTAAIVLLQATPPPAAGWLGPAPRGIEFQNTSGAGFSVDVPRKDWLVVPPAGGLVLAVVHRSGRAAIYIERSKLNQPLGPDDVTDLFAQLEADTVRERQSGASAIEQKLLTAGDRRLVAVQFDIVRGGGSDRVRQYSFPSGTWLFRVSCTAPAADFAKYEPVFAYVAASFQPVSAP